MHFSSPNLQSAMLFMAACLTIPTFAADCGQSGNCFSSGATRDNMYAARQEVCGTNRWKKAGHYRVPGKTGYLRWTGVDTQQTCWDAYDNIINQCKLGDSGVHTHSGQYQYNGVYYNAVDCE
ncbi:hypothetical protein AC578_8687 [Pseudocercospora eumusae]|uniref:Uncharacterized protein n=1 Tax=Pseudocercospora eumusae TaxID=321146 RepID=A0A139HQ62_9PEZI|nr:hypothetical protein AC578_8687 [Pseudocercospora eumusae]